MAYSFRQRLYEWPNLAAMGTQIPGRLKRVRPPYADNPPIVPPRDPKNPFRDPPHFHEVDPPEMNPYNDPEYFNRIVTERISGRARDEPGGLLGMLLRAAREQSQAQAGANPRNEPKRVRILARRPAG